MALKPVAEAILQVTQKLAPGPQESVELAECLGRVLAENVVVGRDQPPFDASSMDGYAVRAQDIAGIPTKLKLIGEAPAGGSFSGIVQPGEAVRIFTGAPMPKGADKVVIQEIVEAEGDLIEIIEAPSENPNIRPRGLDFAKGDQLLTIGTKLNARGLALAASANRPMLEVRRKPKVAILATGNELVMPGETPNDDQIISSNSFAIAALIKTFGGAPHDLGIAQDNIEDLMAKVEGAEGADILVTIGGASVGDHDLVQAALSKAGLKVDFWRIAMRPGKPLMFGEMGALKVLGLPGNPVSALVCARIFLKPMLDKLLGIADSDNGEEYAILGADLPQNGIRQAYLRATLRPGKDGLAHALPFEAQDSAMLRNLHNADCLIIRPVQAKPAAKGDKVQILRLDF